MIPPFNLGPIRFTHFRGGQESDDFMREVELNQAKYGLPAKLCRGDTYPEKDSPSLMFRMDLAATGRRIGTFILYKPRTLSRAGQVREISVVVGLLMEDELTAAWGQAAARIFKALLQRDIEIEDGRIYRVVEIRFPGFDPGDDPTHVWRPGLTPNFLASLAAQGLVAQRGNLPDPEDPQHAITPVLRLVTLAP